MDTVHLSDYDEVKARLIALKKRGVRLGLDRMRRFTEALGHPEQEVPCVHIAGTNGKGSVAAMLEAIFRAAGWRCGLYTSPHLVKLGERIQVDRHNLSEADLVAYTRELAPVAAQVAAAAAADHEHPSYFEFMTAMAFVHFVRRQCDVAIIEVGLGGRLDATNVVNPEASVITSIGIDHADLLGDSIEQIARGKAGIVKPGGALIMGLVPAAAESVIRAVAADRAATVFSVRDEFGDNPERYPETNLEGGYQRANAATAVLTARVLAPRWRLDDATVRRGLRDVFWPGRWQRSRVGGRPLILDASHNPDGARVLDVNLAELARETSRAPVVIAGVLGARRAKPLLEVICRHAAELHLVVPNQARACSHAELESFVPASFRGAVVRATVGALFPAPQVCTAGRPDTSVVVTGSIYLLGEVMAQLDPAYGPVESDLQDF